MGTNYYAIPKADPELKERIKAAIDVDDFATASELMPREIHIGKSSTGWPFLFNHNNWKYFGDKRNGIDCIESFLKGCSIMDEYRERISFETFWGIVTTKNHFRAETIYGCVLDGLNYSNYTEFS